MEIAKIVKECHKTACEKGWWDRERNLAECIALMHSELSEALEAARRQDNKGLVEELADCCIRIFDFCGHYNLDIEKALREKMEYNKRRPYRHGNKLY